MLELVLKLYLMYMATDVRTPVPHLVGPPGCGKSTAVEQAAQTLGVNLHIINVSRLSPLDLEGVQMPHGQDEAMALRLLHATTWTQIKPGDIVLYDELLRGFPEVYNGLLDIWTSRKVAGLVLPQFFAIGASNSTTAYDKALEDRLLHLPVPDPRHHAPTKKLLARLMVDALGLHPNTATTAEMVSMLDTEVLPMYDILDSFKNHVSTPGLLKGKSLRNLIGQAQLRQVETPALAEVIKFNNLRAMAEGKVQYVFFLSGKDAVAHPTYQAKAEALRGNARLTPVQATNLELNLQLIELEATRNEREEEVPDDGDEDIFSV